MIAQLDRAFLKARPSKLWSRILAYILFEGRPLTTKGQWFNPVVFNFYKLCRKVKSKKKIDDPIFIVGMGRSGTTALGSVLSIHRGLAYLNEPKALWYSVNEKDDIIGSYSQGDGVYRLTADDVTPDAAESLSSVYAALLKMTLANRVVDKYPELLFRMSYVMRIFPNAKFILLTRNGLDNAKSVAKWCESHKVMSGESAHDWWGDRNRKWHAICSQLATEHDDLAGALSNIKLYSEDFDKAVVEWIVTMREVMSAEKVYPDNVLRVDYDTICEQPELQIRKILEFVDVDSADNVVYDYANITLARKSKSNSAMQVDHNVRKVFDQTMKAMGYL